MKQDFTKYLKEIAVPIWIGVIIASLVFIEFIRWERKEVDHQIELERIKYDLFKAEYKLKQCEG